ncbi:MAG: hypothetical protein GWN00_00810 [Aliifodinibius sp.]|nr:SHOCT domain-containing protein [Fodinibius sp.]NIW43329.1 hypothetical protein [Gammaproteobacteria bacterium]NIY23403.1 hypothetical protein [Fodinibius sp.]
MMAGVSTFGLLVMILFWGGLIVFAIWLVKTLFTSGQISSNGTRRVETSARRILDKRFARGEITREIYELMKSDLEK